MGNSAETSIGGGGGAFPRTTMGLVSRLWDPATNAPGPGFEELCRRYWKPVYCYVRIAWGKSNDDAKDLAQAFFLNLFEGSGLRRYASERGSLRAFLKVLLSQFVVDRERALHRLKRGGGTKILALDDGALPEAPAAGSDPDRDFDRAWVETVLREAIERVRARFTAEGRAAQLRAFEEYDLASTDCEPTYAEVARRLGLKESDVRNHLFAVREALRGEIRAELQHLTTDSASLEAEWKELFGA